MSVRDEIITFLDNEHQANPTTTVEVIIENTSGGVDRLTFVHAAGGSWS